jgi:hypothetical protein
MNAGELGFTLLKIEVELPVKSAEACIASGCCKKLVWIDCRTQPEFQASLLWFENCIPSWYAHCIASAQAEMESAPSFLAAIQWVLMQPIRETKSHSRLMRALAGASIRASLQAPCAIGRSQSMQNDQTYFFGDVFLKTLLYYKIIILK